MILLNSEYVFIGDKPFVHTDKKLAFAGMVGYARPGELALFEGTELRLGKFGIVREGGDFGVSASLRGRRITGHIAGRSGGRVRITPPITFESKRVKATFAGRPLPVMIKDGTIHFALELKQADGTRKFTIDL